MNTVYIDAILEIKKILEKSKSNIVKSVNKEMLLSYWNIDKILFKKFCNEGEISFIKFSKMLNEKFKKGFSRSNIQNMIKLYKVDTSGHSLTSQLSWAHYCELLSKSEGEKRMFYEKKCINSKWCGKGYIK